MANFYENQLNQIKVKELEYAPCIQIAYTHTERTKWMELNKESAEALVAWLKNNYLTNK